MTTFKVFGSTARLREVLRDFPGVKPVGGHTLIQFKPGSENSELARSIYTCLVTEYAFTPLDTTIPDAPLKAPRTMPAQIAESVEYTFIPQFAGG